jgi:hypothetical protein
MYFRRFINTNFGRILLSIILGLGLASLVRKGCESGECYRFKGVNPEKVKGKVFEYENKCYQFELKPVSRNNQTKMLDFKIE